MSSQQSFIFIFPCRYEINVPNYAIGAVIGKGGSIIDEITSLSGASIDINKVDIREGQSPDPDKIIRISGSTHAVYMAKSLITIALALDLGRNRGLDNIKERESMSK